MKAHLKRIATAALLTLLPYTTGWRHAFVYDDHAVIEENLFLTTTNAWSSVLTFDTMLDPLVPDSGRPLVILTYLCDRATWGLQPAGFRATNWMLHVLAIALVYTLAWRISGSAFTAFASALAFGLHPVLLEVVHSPAFREDILATAGVIAILLAAGRGTRFLIVLTIATLASKESGVVAIPLLWWFWLCHRRERPPIRRATTILAAGATLTIVFLRVWLAAGTFQSLSRPAASPPLSFPANLWTAPWLFLRLARFLLWPHPLRADHVIVPVVSATDPRFILGLFVLAALAAASLALRTRHPVAGFALGWLIISFIPVSNLIPLHNAFAERYAYMPCVGFAIIVASLLERINRRAIRSLALALLASLYALAITRNLRAWETDFSLWQHTLAYEPQSARAWIWTGLELKKRGLRAEAQAHFQRAKDLNPSEVAALINLGIMLGEDGHLQDAELILRRAVESRPDKAEAWWNLAVCLHLQGKDEAAQAAARCALERNPYFAPARSAFDSFLGPQAVPSSAP